MPNSESELAKAARQAHWWGNALYGRKASKSFALGWSLAFVRLGMRSSKLGFISRKAGQSEGCFKRPVGLLLKQAPTKRACLLFIIAPKRAHERV